MRIAVSGVNGFVGRHLVKELVDHGHEVEGLGLGAAHPGVAPLLSRYDDVDLRSDWPDTQAEAVVHLAALSAVGPSFAEPQLYIEANSAPMTNLGELAVTRPDLRLVVVSTGAVYGRPGERVLRETDDLLPTSPYVVSKMVTEAQTSYYRARGVNAVVMRPFNHVGPGQGPGFLLPDLVAGLAAWRERNEPIVAGDLSTRRDYTDVRDVVRAYRLAVESENPLPPVLNVCSGVSVSGYELLAELAEAVGAVPPPVTIDPARVRPSDPRRIEGSNDAIREYLGWTPSIPLRTTVRDVIAHAHPALVDIGAPHG